MNATASGASAAETLFKDPVHGYIAVPKDLCARFVDMAIFQRLRHIEQTSMRPLYPGARHDRFIHSLGVFHLASRVYAALCRNTSDADLLRILGADHLRQTFLIACLMHDCGHAPYSHTFESFYNYEDAPGAKHAFVRLREVLGHHDFQAKRAGDETGFEPAEHEAVSAIVLFQQYSEDATKHGWDSALACRMITGCVIPSPQNDREKVHNALIGLLNGNAIDCDKLDYIVRDTWASGVKNVAVDTERLVNSYCLVRDGLQVRICHQKSAISVIQTVVDARNYLFEWVYGHHTVLYHAELLRRALKRLAKHLSSNGQENQFWETVFSERAFVERREVGGFPIHMPTDADLSYLLKTNAERAGIVEYDEVFNRAHKRFALWKTFAEFRHLFKGSAVTNKKGVYKSVAGRLPAEFAQRLGCPAEEVMVVFSETKHYSIGEGDIWISYPDGVEEYRDLFPERNLTEGPRFFYVFVPNEFKARRDELVRMIQGMQR